MTAKRTAVRNLSSHSALHRGACLESTRFTARAQVLLQPRPAKSPFLAFHTSFHGPGMGTGNWPFSSALTGDGLSAFSLSR